MYLKTIYIKNFRGIKELKVSFNQKINIIIGSNGSYKTTLIDAIRLFYGWGDTNSNLEIGVEDFHRELIKDDNEENYEYTNNQITIEYTFDEMSDAQKGAFSDYIFMDSDKSILGRVTIEYHLDEKERVSRNYYSGIYEAQQKADYESFQLFKSYYLSALRDSTRDLMNVRNNILGRVIKRKIENNNTTESIKNIIKIANDELLKQKEVVETENGINNNLQNIFYKQPQQVGLQISQSRLEYIINVIKPYLPRTKGNGVNCSIWENSLGYNNLIYIATVLSDISDFQEDETNSICALFIEEPEAHLHPQIQINLYNFLKNAGLHVNTQVFVTTHSPTLTSRVPLENLILLNGDAYNLANCFVDREQENIVIEAKSKKKIKNNQVMYYKNMLSRYIDVTRSQLFFSKGALFVEGISEGLLMNAFSNILGKSLIENEIELVNVEGTAFGQFIMLFNSNDRMKRLPIKAAFITDGDQFTDSKKSKYNLDKLIENNYSLLNELRINIYASSETARVENMKAMSNKQKDITVKTGVKTLEYQIALSNVFNTKKQTQESIFYKYLRNDDVNLTNVEDYINTIESETLSVEEQRNIAILLWKCMPGKSDFAQQFACYLDSLPKTEREKFIVPEYIKEAITFLIP